jgi:uncharacterized protein (TIGR01777 family)
VSRRILVSGSNGFIGTALVAVRRSLGDTVASLVRGPATLPAVSWDDLTPSAVAGFDAVVHLAGEPLTGRWTAAKKRAIFDSRVGTTAALASALAREPPGVFVCASGINFYGDHGDAIVDETTPAGSSFLAAGCVTWEGAAAPLPGRCRVVHLRTAMVLAAHGGPLATMLPAFRLGLGGPIAGGRRYVSWVTLDDTVRAIGHAIESPTLVGPANVTAPEPVTNRQFTAALAKAVGRPAIVPVPAWVIRLAVGELGSETALTSIRAVPRRLTEDWFTFGDVEIGAALRRVLTTEPGRVGPGRPSGRVSRG